MNIIKREMRSNLKSLIIWGLSMVFLVYVGMVKYSGFVEAGDEVDKMFEQMPQFLKSMFGIGVLDLTSIPGYYAVFYIYFMLLAGIHAVMLGSIIISKEEKDKTADFLYTRPVKRTKIITYKIIAMLINIIIFNLITMVSSIFFVDIYNKGEPINDKIISLMGTLFIFQLTYASIGLLISSITKNIKKATSYSTLILLVNFLIYVAVDMSDKVEKLKYFSPFRYFSAVDVMLEKSHEIKYFIISFAIISISVLCTYVVTKKRDIHV